MADAANKYPENVEGKFYVDDQCIDCDLCRETAPANYKRNDDGGHSFVYTQQMKALLRMERGIELSDLEAGHTGLRRVL